jgi:putative endonuclease
MVNTKTIGNDGEDKASKYIISKNIDIIEKNFNTRYGEIDIIGIKNKIIYFYEVKYRSSSYFGHGEEAISKSKIRKLKQSIEIWINKNRRYLNYDKYLNAIIISYDNEIVEFEIL